MKIKEKITLGYSCLQSLFLSQRKPIIVSWEITKRCNLHCTYCHVWNLKSVELRTFEVLQLIKKLSKAGTRIIRFTGGEPFLRDDISKIIDYAFGLGISVAIATNGTLLPEKINEIKQLSAISLSLEGPESIHDSIRGLGTHKKAIDAINVAKNKNIPVSLSATLNSLNLDFIDYLLNIAKHFKVKIFFQPATKTVLYGETINPIAPDENQYKKAMLSLATLKKKNKFLGNSIAGLKHLSFWPNKKAIYCAAGKIICRLDSAANMNPCPRVIIEGKELNIIKKDILYCFSKLYSSNCKDCWCSLLVELNIISKFNMSAVFNSLTNTI